MSGYSIRVEFPARAGRRSSRLIVVVEDPQGVEIFRDLANVNEEKTRIKISERIAQLTGDTADDVNQRLLRGLAQIQPPGNVGGGPGPGPQGQTPPYPYEATPAGIIWNKETPGGIVLVPLTTFTALITGQVAEDDGTETRRVLEIEAVLRGRTYRFRVPSGQFSGMAWAMEHMGAAAALWPGFSAKDHARAAIQFLSGDPPERQVYAHLGWCKIGVSWCYLHSGGAIGPMGPVPEVELSLPSDLERYLLPVPPIGADQVDAVQASMRLLKVASDGVVFAVYCAIWRTILGGADSSLHLFGQTGGGKSELAALTQQHFGAGLDSRHLPGNWSSTDNALESLAFTAKDALLAVDDFCPSGSTYDVQAMYRKADRLFRAQGNTSGRQRLRPDGTPRPIKPPRGMILSTGEDVPKGQSLRARVLVIEVPKEGPDALDWTVLTSCQHDASGGLYAQAMAGYLRWLAPRYEGIQAELKTKILQLREQAYQTGQHRRTPDIVANLAIGFSYFLVYAQEVGAVDQIQADDLWQRCWDALGKAASAQEEHQVGSEPVAVFLELLSSALGSGRAHLAGADGGTPDAPKAWGWREVEIGTGLYARRDFQPQGERIGWIDGAELYLQADAAYAAAQKLARDEGDNLPVTLSTLKRRLKEQGFLASVEQTGDKERLVVRRTLEGRRRHVLHIKPGALSTQVGQVRQVGHDDQSTEPSDSNLAGAGPQIGAQTELPDLKVRQESAPEESSSVSGGTRAGALGALGPPMEVGLVADEFIDEVLE